MLNTIPGWECLKNERAIENGEPWQYVAFATSGYIRAVFDDEALSAMATIGQRNGIGRLFQSSLHSRHFSPRKCTITVKDAAFQIPLLHQLIAGLNDGTIDPESIPKTVSSARAWDAIRTMLECSVGPIDA